MSTPILWVVKSVAFLKAVLGKEGYSALRKAFEIPRVGDTLISRTVLAWVGTAADGHDGVVPGNDVKLVLRKTESGLSGSVGDAEFKDETVFRVAARLIVAMDVRPDTSIKHSELARLGKSIDVLVRAKSLDLKKKLYDEKLGYKFTHRHDDAWEGQPRTVINVHSPHGDHVGFATFHHTPEGGLMPFGVAVDDAHQRQGIASHMYAMAERITGKKVVPSKVQTPEGAALWQGNAKQPQFGKTELPARTAGAIPPGGPGEAQPPNRVQRGRIPGRRTIKMPASSIMKSCCVCGSKLFKHDRLACICWRELSSSANLEKTEDGYVIKLGSKWDEDAIAALTLEVKG